MVGSNDDGSACWDCFEHRADKPVTKAEFEVEVLASEPVNVCDVVEPVVVGVDPVVTVGEEAHRLRY